jgi:heterodisulfide reductase subunit A
MEIQTHSEHVLKIRRILAELMLARCPESEVVRDLAYDIGVGHCRFERPRGEKAPCHVCGACSVREQTLMETMGGVPATIVGKGGCILCGMCVRICDDVMKVGALAFEGRGMKRRVTTPFGTPSEFCITCGACSSVCPTGAIEMMRIRSQPPRPIPSEFEEGLAERKPIYIPFPQAVPRVPTIDADSCVYFQTGGCQVCADNCHVEAIDHTMQDKIEEVEVGSIIVATGFQLFDAKEVARYGYGRFKDVVNSLEFERLSHAGGPTKGEILTSQGKPPESVVIVHCVGSRDENYQEYCSRVCCMYSLKFAHLVKEKTGARVYNCYIDMRTPGKGYEAFYRRLLREDVQFIRGKVAEVSDVAESAEEEGKLVVVCEDTLLGITRRLPCDMVILSAGLKPQQDVDEVARTFSLSCSQGDFFLERHPKLAPVEAASDGLFLAGACQGPKDIPDSVAQGAAAAACALALADKGSFVLEPISAFIEEDRCCGCKTCITTCPYSAIEFDEEKSVSIVVEELCKGCGTCVATCPSGAATQKGFQDDQIYAEIDGILEQLPVI